MKVSYTIVDYISGEFERVIKLVSVYKYEKEELKDFTIFIIEDMSVKQDELRYKWQLYLLLNDAVYIKRNRLHANG